MHRAFQLFATVVLASLALVMASCVSDEKPRGPSDDVSGLPWNRPMPGDRGSGMGGMPFQSH